eukprot:12781835-Ditylum_brightwellii.AAC.1
MVEEDEMNETPIPEEEWEKWEEKVMVVIYNKGNQLIKYVNRESCHRASVFKAISKGVFT